MPPVVNALIELYGWRNAYLVFGGTTLVMLFPIIYLFMKDRPEEVGEVRDGRAYVERHANDVIEMRRCAFGHLRDVSITSVLEYRRDLRFHDLRIHRGDDALVLASTRHWYRPSTASFIMSTAAFAALGKPVMGWLADYFGAKVTIWLELFCQGTALLIFGTAQSVELSILAACLYGFGYAGMSPCAPLRYQVRWVVRVLAWPRCLTLCRTALFAFCVTFGRVYHDTTGNYQMAFLILVGLIAVACIGPLFIVSGGANLDALGSKQQNKTRIST